MPWNEEHLQGDDLKDDNYDNKSCPKEHVSKSIKSEAVSFIPTVKHTSEQVGRALEEQLSRIEE